MIFSRSVGSREHIKCTICGASNNRHLFDSWDMWHDLDNQARERFSYVQCRSCGLAYLNPRVLPEEIAAYYPEDNISHRVSTNPTPKHSKRSMFRQCMENARRALFDNQWNEEDHRPNLQRLWLTVFKKTLRARYDPFDFPGDGLNLLDIGCGVGNYLVTKQASGWNVFGVEPNSRAARICQERGLRVKQGYFDPDDWGEIVFDVVTLLQVIEHLPDPARVLTQIYRVLKPGGLVYITTPNLRSISACLFRTYWIGSDAPRHLFLFTPLALYEVLAKAGLIPIRWYTQSSTSGYTATIEFFLRERLGGKVPQDHIRKNPLLSRLFIPLVRFTDWFDVGDNLCMLAKKPNPEHL